MAGQVRQLPRPLIRNINPPVREYRYFDGAAWSFDPARGLESARNRWLLSECALLAYDEEAKINAAFAGAGTVSPVRAQDEGGFGFVVQLGPQDALLVFRGTQVFKPGDGLAKFRDTTANYFTNAEFAPRRLANGGRVHTGFDKSAGKLFERLRDLQLLAAPRRWWLCGHSLGGALAVLAAERLHHAGHVVRGVLTFGQPRVGDAKHARGLAQLPFPILRIVHGCDVIPSVPPDGLRFTHAGTERVFRPERRSNYPAAVLQGIAGVLQDLDIGALTPVALRDHAPVYYATLCYNEFVREP